MLNAAIRQILLFILLILLQIMLFDKIHLFRVATPMLYIYFILKLPGRMNRNMVLFVSAFLGLCIDLFNHTMGMNMLACTIMGFFRYSLLDLFAPRDLFEGYSPSFRSFGMGAFLRYALVVALLHHFILFTAESLSFFDPLALIFRITGSVILTILLIFAFESIHFDTSKK
ncbi:MAG: rod shape-determining protein MreD [Dysgonamonadaceae bacterium]|jgi:rod shape-determining protein MreD|nr:rod shape-determining protein MreD [Dysgonamonadaceae bacterium]